MSDIGFLVFFLLPVLSIALYILGYAILRLRVKEDLNICSSVNVKKIHRFVSYTSTVFILYILLFISYYMYIVKLAHMPILLILLCFLYPIFIWSAYLIYRKVDYMQQDLSRYKTKLLCVLWFWVFLSVSSIIVSIKTCYEYNKALECVVIGPDIEIPVE